MEKITDFLKAAHSYFAWIAVLVLSLMLYWMWTHPVIKYTDPPKPPFTPAAETKGAEKARHEKKELVSAGTDSAEVISTPCGTYACKPCKECGTIVTLNKDDLIKAGSQIPDDIKNDSDKQIVAEAIIPEWKAPTVVDAVTSLKSGETKIYYTQKPIPFFGLTNNKTLGVDYFPWTSYGKPELDAVASWELLRTGGALWGITGRSTFRGSDSAYMGGFSFRYSF